MIALGLVAAAVAGAVTAALLLAWLCRASLLALAASLTGREIGGWIPRAGPVSALTERSSMLTHFRLSTAGRQFLAHVLVVFLVAFGGQLTAGASGAVSMPTLLALLTAAAAAGLTAVVHFLLGLVPAAPPTLTVAYGVTLKVRSRASQVLVSVLATFLSLFGAALVAGATHVTSLPAVGALVVAAISAAVVGAIQATVRLVPVPKVASAA